MNIEFHNQIMAEYEGRQKKSRELQDIRKAEIYSLIPQIEDIDNEISINGIHFNKMILKGMLSASDAYKALQEKTQELINLKHQLLQEKGYNTNYLELQYCCKDCKDSGYVLEKGRSAKCNCYKQLLIHHLHTQSNLKLTESENFKNFNEEFYPDIVNEDRYGIKISPRQNILTVKNRAIKFVESFNDSSDKNLFFTGPTGVGKTFLSNCIALELIERGRTVLYLTAPVLFDIVNEHKVRAFTDEEYTDFRYKNILQAELLIIDDLGTEPPSASRFAEFLSILNTRQLNNLTRPCKTIISTNIEVRSLYDYYSERIASRIIGNFDLYKIVGDDIRKIKKRTSI